MNINLAFQPDLKPYTIQRLNFNEISPDGIQQNTKSPVKLDLAIYDKGTKEVNKLNEDSYLISTIHIYADLGSLIYHDEITFNSLVYKIVEFKNSSDFSFYRAVANV